eukprot:356988_1
MDTVSDELLVVYGYARSLSKMHNIPRDILNLCGEYIKHPPIQRDVLILRDIPNNTNQEEILSIFHNKNCSKPIYVVCEMNNNWFCHFVTEEDCIKTAIYLQFNGKFKGNKLKARVKSMRYNKIKPIRRTKPKKPKKSLFSFQQLQTMNLKLPQRHWIRISENINSNINNIITICQFNCLAQSLCISNEYNFTFKCNKKYLKWMDCIILSYYI